MHSMIAAAKANPSFAKSAPTSSSTGVAAEGGMSSGKQRKRGKRASKCPGSGDIHRQQQQQQPQQQQQQEGAEDDEEQGQTQQQTGGTADDAGHRAPDHKVARRRRKAPSCRSHPYATA